jgi:hypothetical protein
VQEPNFYKEFAVSKAHAAIGVAVAAAFAAANPLGLMLAAAGYALAWVYFPTSAFFVRRVMDRLKLAEEVSQRDELGEFVKRRDEMIARLDPDGRARYDALSRTCADVAANTPGNSLVNGKLHELLWAYLKMLLMRQGIDSYLAETDGAEIETNLRAVEEELQSLTPAQQRLRASKESLRATLAQHLRSLADAAENQRILASELTRLEHEIQLLRADAIANKNSEFLSAKINASVESLQESKAILQTMSNVEEMAVDVPSRASGLAFVTAPPALPQDAPETKPRQRTRA